MISVLATEVLAAASRPRSAGPVPGRGGELAREPRLAATVRVAYIMSRFPKITETFVLYEMLAVERSGVSVDIYPLLREPGRRMHPEAVPLVRRARFEPFLSWAILRAHAYFLARKPRAYFAALAALLGGTWGSLRFFTAALGIFPKCVAFARRMQADAVAHVHAHFASHPAAAAYVIHRLTGIPFSFTAHGSDLHRDRHMLREKVAAARFVVAISDDNRRLILAECGAEWADKTIVLHCGVDTQVFRPRPAAPARARSPRPFTVLCVGTLHEVKGQRYLIEACRLLGDRGAAVVCEFVGEGPDRSRLERLAVRAGVADRVRFYGRKTRGEVAALLEQADVLAAPSVPTRNGRREGIPVVLMEAMASGLPVVASRLSGIPELVEHDRSGLLAPPGDAPALADAIERLIRDPALGDRLGRAGRAKVQREFDLSANAAALAARWRETACMRSLPQPHSGP